MKNMRKIFGASIIMLLMTLSFGTVAVGIFNDEIELKELSFSKEIEGSVYDGDLRIYVVEQVSRWDAQDGNPYKFGFLDFALDDKLSIEYLDTFTDMIAWDANDAGYSNVQENNLMVIAAVFNPEIHKGYSDPPFGSAFDAFYVDATAGATPGSTGYNTVNEDFTHTVLVEKATSTTCPYCPAMANALYSIYNSDDYPFYYVSLVTNKNQNARTYLKQTYNYKYVPTAYFDGGYSVLVGGYGDEAYYRSRIESCGQREVPILDFVISVELVDAITLEVEVSITPNNAPENPTIEGPSSGNAGEEYEYIIKTTDPEDQDVYYYVDWDDGNTSEWIGPYNSNEDIAISHMWSAEGSYTIQVKAKDTKDIESDWTTLEVTMPKTKTLRFNQLFQKFMDRQVRLFSLFKNLFEI